MRTFCVKNGLVMVVILLFIGVAVQPGIIADVSIESDSSELVEITVEIYEVNRVQKYNMMLTQEQAEKLELLINNTKTELDTADNSGETEAIFKDTVLSLNELGLLTNDMNVEKVQRLVTGKEQNPKMVKLLERWIDKNPNFLGNRNALCLIAGHSNLTLFDGPIAAIAWILLSPFMGFQYITVLYILLIETYYKFINQVPILFGHRISFGIWDYPAEGWLTTIGLNGIKRWSGSFYGQILHFLPSIIEIHPGVYGFTGIRICIDIIQSNQLYFGAALWVHIREE